ncbi:RHS repeat domain-containing protein [Chishuiella sp.]|uniref:RHS repeat domain-containing protein n=1 Tax=Chishuiella sp. TaxID=1969467 RepID=UPI0028AC09A8|nr:RHS repeat domain-containing protein [Chishuiella sp.]
MKKIILFLLLSINSFSQSSVGQNNYNSNIDLYPKSPEAYAFSKFVDIPAGSNTGVANFNIPIYTIKVDDLTIPIQFDYSTAGIKVDEISSRVGLGWSLNAGPSLSVQVIGTKDSNTRKVFNPESFHPNDAESANNPSYEQAVNIVGNDQQPPEDYKPDIYSYSLGNYSGKFIIDSQNSLGIPIPYYPIKIKKDNGLITILDDQGNEYSFFNEASGYSYNTCASFVSNAENSTYVLKHIKTKNNKNIKYEYDYTSKTIYATGFSEQKKIDEIKAVSYYGDNFNGQGPDLSPFCLFYTNSREPVLRRIKFDENIIEFNYNNKREDLPGEVFLEQILVKDNNNKLIKNFKLNQKPTYFTSASLDINSDLKRQMELINSNLLKGIDKRLKLEEVVEILSNQKYKLEYYDDKPLINRFSFAQDFWGVYNGIKNQQTSIPITFISNFSNKKSKYGGANKSSNFEFGVIGNLKKINYPSGGNLTIDYEPDQYFVDNQTIFSDTEFQTFYNTRMQNEYVDFSVGNFEIYDLKLNFTGDNDDGTGIAKIGNCYLSIVDKATNKNLIKTPYNYFSGDASYAIGDIKGKNLRMSIIKGYDMENEKNIECDAAFSWTEENNKSSIIPEHNEKIGTIRIKSILLDDKNENKISREYKYTESESDKGSGVLYGENEFRTFYTRLFTKGNSQTAGKQIIITNNPGWQINTINGKSVIYRNVTEIYKNLKNPKDNFTKTTLFNNKGCKTSFNGYDALNFIYPICNEAFLQGKIEHETYKNSIGNIVKEVKYDYKENYHFNQLSSSYLPFSAGIEYGVDIVKKQDEYGFVLAKFDYTLFSINNSWIQNTKTTTTDYLSNGKTIITSENNYSPTYNHSYPSSNVTTNSKGETLTIEYQYPPDWKDNPIAQRLTAENRIAEPLTVVQKNGSNNVISAIYNEYNDFSGILQKSRVFQKKGNDKFAEGDDVITYNSYDNKGNITQYTPKNGIPVSIIWGYNGQYPIAKIEGVSYTDISSFVTTLENASNGGTLTKDSFTNLRNALPKAMITTYIYQPLVGVTSITGPNGQTEFYKYDDAGRLQEIKNDKGEVLKTFEYNYKN